MGSVCSTINCKHCGGEDCVSENYYYKYGGYTSFCFQCGAEESHVFARDDEGNQVFEDVRYPVTECRLVVKDLDTKEEIWNLSLAQVEELTTEKLIDWINEKWTPSEIPNGYHNIYHGEEQLFYIGNKFEVEGNTFCLKKAVWEHQSKKGYGVIKVDNNGICCTLRFPECLTKEAAMEYLNGIQAEYKGIVSAIWFNSAENKFENL